MIRYILIILCAMIGWHAGQAQKRGKDTLPRFLNERLQFVSKSNAVFPALQIKSDDHWLLYSVYPDTTILLRAYFRDKDLTIKDGPFTLYHPRRVRGADGMYKDNIKQGVWKYWYPNGQLKDSGKYKNNYYVGEWKSWDDSGRLIEISHHIDTSVIQLIAEGTATDKERLLSIVAGDTIVSRLEGVTVRYYPDGHMLDSGAYKNNQKHGPWKYWYKGGIPESSGGYYYNKQDGEWAYFRDNGTLSTKEIYKDGKVVSLECYDEQGNHSGNSCSLLKPPVAQGDFRDFNQYALDHMFWPEKLKKTNVAGDVLVQYTITKDGQLKNFKILSSPHPLMSEEVTRFFMTLEHWSPAMSHNRPVEYTTRYKVPFYR